MITKADIQYVKRALNLSTDSGAAMTITGVSAVVAVFCLMFKTPWPLTGGCMAAAVGAAWWWWRVDRALLAHLRQGPPSLVAHEQEEQRAKS